MSIGCRLWPLAEQGAAIVVSAIAARPDARCAHFDRRLPKAGLALSLRVGIRREYNRCRGL
ncbi:protein of unknown function [Bradyrhizobium vignae]|uniref:Uncharacterized protein n=1 Tax=Bradyrhizobium vignae TaxID=1549949 RepID=A0A2U3PRA6_9BRAD|nr:protein of unknown function [Bradyrhizobium vignae]